jgi:hypothetical protein
MFWRRGARRHLKSFVSDNRRPILTRTSTHPVMCPEGDRFRKQKRDRAVSGDGRKVDSRANTEHGDTEILGVIETYYHRCRIVRKQ